MTTNMADENAKNLSISAKYSFRRFLRSSIPNSNFEIKKMIETIWLMEMLKVHQFRQNTVLLSEITRVDSDLDRKVESRKVIAIRTYTGSRWFRPISTFCAVYYQHKF